MTPLQITCDSLELSELETVGELNLSLVRIYFSLKTQKSKTAMCSICKSQYRAASLPTAPVLSALADVRIQVLESDWRKVCCAFVNIGFEFSRTILESVKHTFCLCASMFKKG